MNVGEKIRSIRKNKRMTQRKLAEIIGCKSSFVSHIEHNSRNVSLNYLSRIAKALETPTYCFVSNEGDKIVKALNLLEGLNNESFGMAIEYLEYLANKNAAKIE
ncbi:MAG: helix-turn-helix transcriptional regulator [Candidatus Omnitrophica bacterium]|nr:helix-turn-helix transcriptional regulator [Candidatus Omnitrophota bacterium]